MTWVLWIFLFWSSGPSAGTIEKQYRYTDAPPFTTLAACQEAGHDIIDGDGDNEHYICVPIG